MVGPVTPADDRWKGPGGAPERRGAGPVEPSPGPGSSAPIVVVLIDDRKLLGESLATAINAGTPDLVMIHRTGAEALADPAALLRGTDIILLSVGRAALTAAPVERTLRRLLGPASHPPVAVLVDRAGPEPAAEARQLGLRGIVGGTMPLDGVVGALRRIHRGATVVLESS